MSQVASDINTHALKPTFQHAARPAPDRAQSSPFESLLDDTQPPPSRPAPDDNAPRADRTEPTRRTDRAKDSKDAKSSDDANSAPPPEDKPDVEAEAKPDAETADKSDAKSSKPAVVADTKPADGDIKTDTSETDTDGTCDGKPAADAKTADQAANIVDVKPAGDAKPVNVPLPVDPTAVAAPTTTPADAIATVLAPAPIVVAQAASSAEATAVVATTQPKSDAPVNLQADADKSTDEQKALAKTVLQAQTDAKPQATAGDSDKNSVAQFRGETSVNSHRGTGAETHAPVTPDANLVAPKTGADMMPPTILNAPSHNTAPAINSLTLAPQLPPQAAPIPLAGLAFEITNKALAGKNHFEIRLDPPELGRIEVRLDVDRDGNVTSRMIADRSDTLDLLRRDASGLERALQDAGLKTANNSLQFSLRDQSMGQQQTGDGADAARLAAQDEALLAIEPKQIDYGRLAGRAGGLDIRV